MFATSSPRRILRSVRKKPQKISRTPPLIEKTNHHGDLRSSVGVRFLIKRSKRFCLDTDSSSSPAQTTSGTERNSAPGPKTPHPECLHYLGLSPRGTAQEPSKSTSKEDFRFQEPRIYECEYCSRIFFHRVLHRRHVMRHLRRIHFCSKCNQGFVTRNARRIHRASCRR